MRIVPVGELDLATGGELEAQSNELRHTGVQHVVQCVLDVRRLRDHLRFDSV